MPFQPPYPVPAPRRAYTMLADGARDGQGNGRVGLLLLHGFMGSPTSTRDMAAWLRGKDITCHCPLLPGHGNLPYMIHGYHRRQWVAEAEEALASLRQWAEQIFIVGHSMGAVLAAQLIKKNPDIYGLIMLAPLYDVPDWRIKLSGLVQRFMPFFYPLKRKDVDREVFLGRVVDFDPTIDVDDPDLQEWLIEASRIPLSGVAQMLQMARLGRKLWPKLQIPALILQGGKDPAVSPGNAEKIYNLLPTGDKQLKLFPNVGHELMRPFEPIHKTVWQMIADFIAENAEPPAALSSHDERSRQSLRS